MLRGIKSLGIYDILPSTRITVLGEFHSSDQYPVCSDQDISVLQYILQQPEDTAILLEIFPKYPLEQHTLSYNVNEIIAYGNDYPPLGKRIVGFNINPQFISEYKLYSGYVTTIKLSDFMFWYYVPMNNTIKILTSYLKTAKLPKNFNDFLTSFIQDLSSDLVIFNTKLKEGIDTLLTKNSNVTIGEFLSSKYSVKVSQKYDTVFIVQTFWQKVMDFMVIYTIFTTTPSARSAPQTNIIVLIGEFHAYNLRNIFKDAVKVYKTSEYNCIDLRELNDLSDVREL